MVVSTPALKYEKRNQIAYITLNRPEVMNALNMEIRGGLQEALVDVRDDPETHGFLAVVLEHLGDPDGAREAARRAQAVRSNQP